MFVITLIVLLALVAGVGLLVFTLIRRNQKVVPDMADRQASRHDRVVAVDDEGRPVTEAEAGDDAEPRDDAAFESVLKDQLDDLRH